MVNPFYVLSLFSCLYLTQIVPVSPFYFGIVFAILLLCCNFSVRVNLPIVQIKRKYIPLFFHGIILFAYVVFNAVLNACQLKYPALQGLSFLFLICSFFLSTNTTEFATKTLKRVIFIVLILLLIEFVYRITHPQFFKWATDIDNFFYIYKFSSIMFSDTNETGFFIMMFTAFLVYLNDKKVIKIPFIILFISFSFIVGTFSRAAVFGFVVFLFYNNYFKKQSIQTKFFIVFCAIFSVFGIITFFMNDGSFLTKIEIFSKSVSYLCRNNIREFLFGVGMNNSINALGIYGHNYISLYFIEYGAIGMFLFTSFLIHIFFCNAETKYLLIPYIITGLSFAPYFIPYFFFFIGFILQFEERSK